MLNHKLLFLLRIAALTLIGCGALMLWEIWYEIPRKIIITNSDLSQLQFDFLPEKRLQISNQQFAINPFIPLVQIFVGLSIIMWTEIVSSNQKGTAVK